MTDQSPAKKKKKGNADGTAICIIHVVHNAKGKVSGFTEQSCKVQSPCFRIYYMHDLLCVLTFYRNIDIHGPNQYLSLLNTVL